MNSIINVSIVVTSFNDYRALELVKVLRDFDPFEIIIADGGSKADLIEKFKRLEDGVIKLYDLPGNIAETRFQVQDFIKGEITVFIDTDEIPIDGWLNLLISPIIEGKYDFTFGSTVPLRPATSRYSNYLDKYDSFLYSSVVEHDVMKGAMGNSAWRTKIVKEVGFDPCLGIGGEDYDLTIRAINSGYKGGYIKNSTVGHDQNSISTFRKFVKKIFYNYLVGAALVYRKNKMLFKRSRASASVNAVFKDPLEIIVYLLKPAALIFSLMLNPWEDRRHCRISKKSNV